VNGLASKPAALCRVFATAMFSQLVDGLAQVLDAEADIAPHHAAILPAAELHQLGFAAAAHDEPAGPVVPPIMDAEPGEVWRLGPPPARAGGAGEGVVVWIVVAAALLPRPE